MRQPPRLACNHCPTVPRCLFISIGSLAGITSVSALLSAATGGGCCCPYRNHPARRGCLRSTSSEAPRRMPSSTCAPSNEAEESSLRHPSAHPQPSGPSLRHLDRPAPSKPIPSPDPPLLPLNKNPPQTAYIATRRSAHATSPLYSPSWKLARSHRQPPRPITARPMAEARDRRCHRLPLAWRRQLKSLSQSRPAA